MAGTLKVNQDGTWKTASNLWCKVSDSWKEADKVFCKIDGAWIETYAKITNVTVKIYGAANETIKITPTSGSAISVQTDANGYAGIETLACGSYIVEGSASGYSKTVTISKDTKELYAMPNGTIVYWYGYAPYTPVGKAYAPNKAYFNPQPGITSNRKALTIKANERSITFTQGGTSGTYHGCALYDNVETNGGTLTFLSSGKTANTSAAQVIFSCAENISESTFMPYKAHYVDYQETEVTLSGLTAGTYDIAISAQNNVYNYAGQVTVYAIYIAE